MSITTNDPGAVSDDTGDREPEQAAAAVAGRLRWARSPATPRWKSALKRAGIAYVISRICVLAGAAIVAAQRVVDDGLEGIARPKNAVSKIADVLTSWDGKWYFAIIRDSYPSHIPPDVTWDDYQARTAFFPMFPDMVRVFDKVLPGGDVFAALTLNIVFGAVAIYLIGLLAREIFDEEVAYRSMLLVAFFPGSFVLSFTYSEASLLVFAAGCLLCLHRRQWIAAGLLATLGAATRPNGIALIAACAVAAFIAIRERREWRAVVAPVLAPLGFIGFHLFLWNRTGERTIWFRVQSEAWDEGTSFGITAIKNTLEAFTKPLSSPTDIVTAVSFITMIALVAMAWKKRLPWPVATYTVVVLVLMLAPSTVTARPRFLFTAFPLLISAAAWFRDRERALAERRAEDQQWAGAAVEHAREVWMMTLGLGAAGLVTLTGLYGVIAAIP